jgi:hypothetical protein
MVAVEELVDSPIRPRSMNGPLARLNRIPPCCRSEVNRSLSSGGMRRIPSTKDWSIQWHTLLSCSRLCKPFKPDIHRRFGERSRDGRWSGAA